MPEERFPKQLFSQEWDKETCRVRLRKTWGRVIDDLFVSLGLDKAEWLEDTEMGESSLAYLAGIDECFSKRECRNYEEGHLVAERQLIPQYSAKSQLEFVCIYISVTLKNACMSCLGMQVYTTTELARRCQGTVLEETEISHEC